MLYSSTILARNASSILSHLSHLPTSLRAHHSSSHYPPIPQPPLSPHSSPLSPPSPHPAASIVCLQQRTPARLSRVTPFWSDIPGRPVTQVGKWHAMRERGGEERTLQGGELASLEGENVDWERVWSRSVAGDALPASLRELRQVDVHTVITLTDNAPQGLNQALSSSFTHATKLGLFASSTPFVTGRPYTLIFNGSVKSSGAVGLALSAGPRPVSQTSFPDLPFKTTYKSEGNLISELDNANPTELLISAMENSAAKGDQFYMDVLRDGELWQLHHILTGGPSRGTMALDTETAPVEGTSVQLFHRLMSNDVEPPTGILLENTLASVASPQFGDDIVEDAGSDVTLSKACSFVRVRSIIT
ncbi:hypothetical protein EI94DRAFT_1817694 [Lactarius quietus]|nr:hypothetical protein EI94DRAFT_1817694 [Lactarius quietus]